MQTRTIPATRLALIFVVRETSVISAALISMLVFREPLARRHVLPAVTVAAGILLVASVA